jgi:hypothetical protein
MKLLSLDLLGKPRFCAGRLVLMDDPLASRDIQNLGEFLKLRRFLLGILKGLKILYGSAQHRFGLSVFQPISLRGLHSLSRRFVCRQSNLLFQKLFQKNNITH